MKKIYFCPSSVLLNMETEQMIAASGLKIDSQSSADQWTNKMGGWDSENWSYQDQSEE